MTNSNMKGNGFFYMALEDNHGHTNDVTPSVVLKWSTECAVVNEEFDKTLLANNDLRMFCK